MSRCFNVRRAAVLVLMAIGLLAPATGQAGEADVLAVDVRGGGDGRYTFAATVRHADAGWKHYADGFDILTPDGRVLGTRVLAHPHDHEQPFTRSLGGVAVPDGITTVVVRAHDSVHKYGGATVTVVLPGR